MRQALSFAWRSARRDWKAGETGVLAAALIVAVAAITSVGFFTDRVAIAMRAQAGEALAADLRISSRSPLDPTYGTIAEEAGLRTARMLVFPSVVLAGGNSTLSSVKAVSGTYPLRGKLIVTSSLFGERREVVEIPAPGEVWLAPRLIALLDIEVGDDVQVGRTTFRVGAIVERTPDQGWRFFEAAPTLLMNFADLEATGLVQPASRVRHRLLVAGDIDAVRDYRESVEPMLLTTEDLDTIEEEQPELERALARAERFLGLASLVSVLLAGVAVAMATRRHVQRHLDSVAVMKCLGASQGLILRTLLAQLIGLGLITGLIGSFVGWLAHVGLLHIVRDIVGRELPPAGPTPVLVGTATALIVLAGFAAAPLLNLRRVPPARVLRRDLGTPSAGGLIIYGSAVAAGAALLGWQLQDLELFTWTATGIVGTVLVLAGAAWAMVYGLAPLRHGVGVAWRYGLANLTRRRTETVVQVVAFGLGLMVLLLLSVVRTDLLEGWRETLPEDAPNRFLINIQPDEKDALRSFLEENGVEVPRMYPMVRARITHVDGTPADEYARTHRSDRWFLHREANLTWAPELQEGNRIVEGQWWPDDKGPPPKVLSLELERAERLGIGLGDGFTFDIAGETLEVEVASIREVRWDSFRPNFFMVFPPGSRVSTSPRRTAR